MWLEINKIGDEGAKALAVAPHMTKLEVVVLYGNSIGDEGAIALAVALPRMTNLQMCVSGATKSEMRGQLHWQRPCTT